MDTSALKQKIAAFPKEPGVYLMKDSAGVVIYVGKAKSLRSRVAGYFHDSARHEQKTALMVRNVADVDVIPAPSEIDAFLMESRLIKDVQPRFNIRLRDAKTFPFIQITLRKDYPRVEMTRTPQEHARLFGPFTSARDLRSSIAVLQRVFRFRTCTLDIAADDPSRRFTRPCLLYYVKCCLGPCAALCTKQTYDSAIRNFIRFLSGKRAAVLTDLERQMLKASRELRFEDAAAYRDAVKALKSLDKRSRFTDNPEFYRVNVDFTSAGRALKDAFDLPAPPRMIEGIDISNIHGTDAVGSVVTFIDGVPAKTGYRRYKIRTVPDIDDYRMIAEVVSRRYRRLLDEESPLPDLILIDGGKGHLHAASDALASLSVDKPMLVAIAKREEELFTLRADEPLSLPKRNNGLRLLQYVRDEAHRFALHYHHILRTKRTLGPRTRRSSAKRVKLSVKPVGNESAKEHE